jgi:hypothetical protein
LVGRRTQQFIVIELAGNSSWVALPGIHLVASPGNLKA